MPLPIILAAAAVAASLGICIWLLLGNRSVSRAASSNLIAGTGATDFRDLVLNRSATERTVRPLMHSLADRARSLTPVGMIQGLERRIVLAGRPSSWPLDRVLAFKLIGLLGGGLFGLLILAGGFSALRLIFALAVAALGFFTPDLLLVSRAQERQKAIQLELPDTLDQMTISVEAGLGFEAAMARAGQTGTGALADEIVRTLQEMQIGVSRAEAFRNLAERTEVPDLRQFVLAVQQADAYGIPLASVLRTQAGEQRIKRRQRAEERAMKIPVKIVFPLVLCILPTLFIVVIGPAAMRVAKTMAAG